jgi:hypothetical protein
VQYLDKLGAFIMIARTLSPAAEPTTVETTTADIENPQTTSV